MPPPPQPGGSLQSQMMRSLAGLPAQRNLDVGEAPASPQRDSANLETIAERLWRLWQDVRLIRTMMAQGSRGGGGRGGPGGGGGLSMWGLPNTPLGRLAHFGHGLGNLAGGVRGLAGGNIGGAIMGLRGAAMLSSAGGALGAVGAAAGAVAAPIMAAAALVGFTMAVKEAADEMIKVNHELAKFSPQMAQLFAQREIKEIFRERDRGDQLAASAGQLVREEQNFKDAIFPLETAWMELKNEFLAGFYSSLTDLVNIAKDIAEKFDVEIKKRDLGRDSTFSGMINQAADRFEKRAHQVRMEAAKVRRAGGHNLEAKP